MTEAVIVATARTPIGRAKKGTLRDVRPDDMSAFIIQAVLDKVPAVEPSTVEDVIWGCGQPSGEAGHNLARVASILAGLPDVPGVTVNRFCSSSLMTIRIAAHAVRCGEGDVFVAGGAEAVSRFKFGGLADGAQPNPRFAEAQARTAEHAANEPWSPAEGLPDVYLPMLYTAENVAASMKVSRAEQDEFAARSQQLAVANQESGYWAEEITPYPLADGSFMTKDDGPRPGTTVERLAALEPVLPNGTVTAGNACPLNDGAAAVVVMSDTRARELGLTPLARVVSSGVSALNPEIMGLGPIEARC